MVLKEGKLCPQHFLENSARPGGSTDPSELNIPLSTCSWERGQTDVPSCTELLPLCQVTLPCWPHPLNQEFLLKALIGWVEGSSTTYGKTWSQALSNRSLQYWIVKNGANQILFQRVNEKTPWRSVSAHSWVINKNQTITQLWVLNNESYYSGSSLKPQRWVSICLHFFFYQEALTTIEWGSNEACLPFGVQTFRFCFFLMYMVKFNCRKVVKIDILLYHVWENSLDSSLY